MLVQRITPQTIRLIAGIKSKIGTNQRLDLIRLKSKDRLSSASMPADVLFSCTNTNAADMGTNAASALTESPGIGCKSVAAPNRKKRKGQRKDQQEKNVQAF